MKINIKNVLITLLLQILIVEVALAANPIISHIYTADPAALVYNDTFYIYTGHDEAAAGQNAFVMNDWHVFSSNDMVNWTDHGEGLSLNDFSWASYDAWAGHVTERNGRFYWYVPVNHNTNGWFGIGVAVSNSPTGPFTDALGYALITDSMTPNETLDIDPAVFIDNDGQAYMYWGNATDGGICKVVRLNSDMISTTGPIMDIGYDQLPLFTEAPYMHERNGIYYLSYAAGWPETIHYSTADNPLGPFTHQGQINGTVSSQTNHQSILEFRNQWYFVYHNANLPGGGEFRRSVAIEYLNYNSNGTIQPIVQTSQGVGNSGASDLIAADGDIESYSQPGYFLGHNNFTVTLQNAFVGANDDEWNIVSGLADAGGVSFESVSYPGYFLRHSAYQAQLQQNDGSQLFAQDATFYSRNGLGNSGWTSFESYNFPGLYLMVAGLAVSLAEPQSTQDNQNATFMIASSGGVTQPTPTPTPAPTNGNAVQIESSNFAGYFITSDANGALIANNPNPVESSQFNIVSGLASANSISFESVASPGSYLRHSGNMVYLQPNDQTSLFAEDATFNRVAGLANSSGVSYQSYNFPDQYIRHFNYYLQLDVISDSVSQQDATFFEN